MKLNMAQSEVARVDAAAHQPQETYLRWQEVSRRVRMSSAGRYATFASTGATLTAAQQRWAGMSEDEARRLGPFTRRRALAWRAANAGRYVAVPYGDLVVPLRHLQRCLRQTRGTEPIAAELGQAVFALAWDTAALVKACRPARELLDRVEDGTQLLRLMREHPDVTAMVGAYLDAYEMLESAAAGIEKVLERVDDAYVLATLSPQALTEAVGEVQAVIYGLQQAGSALLLPPGLSLRA